MENKTPLSDQVEGRDHSAAETGAVNPVDDSTRNEALETGEGLAAEAESPLVIYDAAAAPSFAEGEREHTSLTLPAAAPPSPAPVEWKGLDVALFLAFSVVWLLLSQFLSLAGYALLRPLMGWHTPPMALAENAIFVVAVQLVFYAPELVYIVLVVVLKYHQPFAVGIRWRWPAFGQGVRLLLAGVLLAMVVLAGAALLPDRKNFPMEKLFTSPSAVYAVGGLAVLVAPFMEELVFRGVLFSFFERLSGFRIAVPATAVLFAALHYPEYAGAWTHVFMILVVGLVLSIARASTGSLVPSFLLHTAYNATFIGLLFLGTHGFKNLHGIAGGP
jgi:membrane protease YdiL (CAAX protease family)